MKKLTLTILLVLSSFSMVSAEIGLKVGFSAHLGEFTTSGSDSENGTVSSTVTEKAFVGLGAYFVEQNFGFLPGPLARISIGYSQMPYDLKTGKASRDNGGDEKDLKGETDGVALITNNTISATISDYETMYVSLRITDWLYVKAGSVDLDVTTTEDLQTGSTYPNTSLSGDMIGVGLHHQSESGFFGRIEYNDTSIGGTTLTADNNADNTVTLGSISGETLGVSFGKAF